MENNTTTRNISTNDSELFAAYSLDSESVIIMVFLGFQGFVVVSINALVIVLVLNRRALQTVSNLCLGSLALSDMLTGLVVIPLIISCNAATEYNFNTCLAMDLGNRFLAISTILHLLFITMERYYTIVFSKTCSTSSVSIPEALAILSSVWMFSLAASFVQLFWVFKLEEQELQRRINIVYDLVVLCVLVLLPLVAMAVGYAHIFFVLRTQVSKIKESIRYISEQSHLRHSRKEKKALLIYGGMIIVFVTGWFNYFFFTLQEDLSQGGPVAPYWVHVVLLFFRLSTGILNPILYTFLKQDFKHARKSIKFCSKEGNRGSRKMYSRSEASYISRPNMIAEQEV